VNAGALVEDAVLFSQVRIGRGAQVATALLDENAEVGAGARVGELAGQQSAEGDQVAVVGRDSVVGEGGVVTAARPPGAGQHRLKPGSTA
jgi:ADP-glucose pyrophosphorylase